MCGLPSAEVGHRAAAGRRPSPCQPSGASIALDRAHVDAAPRSCRGRRSGSSVDDARRPASVRIADASTSPRPRRASAWAKQRMPLPLISAGCRRRCTAPSARSHALRRAGGPPTSRPSAPMPRRRSHSAGRAPAGRRACGGRRTATRKSLPSPWCLVRCMRDESPSRLSTSANGLACSVDVDPAYPRVAAEPPLLAHGELAGAGDGERRRPRRASTSPREVGEQLLVAERLAGRARQRPRSRRARRPRRRSPRPAWASNRARSAALSAARGQRSPT